MADPPRSSFFFRRINVVLMLGAIAVGWQVWSFRGALNYGLHCQELSELLQDAPLTTIQRQIGGMNTNKNGDSPP